MGKDSEGRYGNVMNWRGNNSYIRQRSIALTLKAWTSDDGA